MFVVYKINFLAKTRAERKLKQQTAEIQALTVS